MSAKLSFRLAVGLVGATVGITMSWANPAFASNDNLVDNVGGVKAAQEFHELLRSSLPSELQSADALPLIHMLPNQTILDARQMSSPTDALAKVATTSLDDLIENTRTTPDSRALSADEELARTPMTMVIVPGIFGEFIPTRGFEEVLSQPSSDREDFIAKVQAAQAANDPNAQDVTMQLPSLADKSVPLTDVINVGSIKSADGKTQVRVVLLYTGFMSTESLGDLTNHAGAFNRRLNKYLALTGPQRIALVGYSRGTDLALEMLSQAKQQHLPYLSSVKGMVSLGGVIWGSTLADNTQDPEQPLFKLLGHVKTLRNSIDPNSFIRTAGAWLSFGAKALLVLPEINKHVKMPSSSDLRNSVLPTGLDVKSLLGLVKLVWVHLGMNSPQASFAQNVRGFQRLVDSMLSGVDSLTSTARVQWWKTHEIPKSLTYYSITAAMPNPESSQLDEQIFDGPYGYSKRSYDDLSLLQNRLDYETSGKIALNDSQVSVAQAMFLPNAIASMNPANAGVRTEMLGTLGTHHWGLALRVVNAMKDGRQNPFPREALLKALAAKVAHDLNSSSK